MKTRIIKASEYSGINNSAMKIDIAANLEKINQLMNRVEFLKNCESKTDLKVLSAATETIVIKLTAIERGF